MYLPPKKHTLQNLSSLLLFVVDRTIIFNMEDEGEVAVSSELEPDAKKPKRTVNPLPPELEKVNTNNMKSILHYSLDALKTMESP
jgi:hypothetical protein